MKTYKKLIYILLSSAFLFTSCMDEDFDDCLYPYNFSFHYASPIEGEEDAFSQNIGHVHLFFYDSDLILVKKHDLLVSDLVHNNEEYSFTASLPMGDYSVVAWGGKGDDQHHLIEPDTHFSYQYSSIHNAQKAELSLLRNETNEVLELPTPFFHSMKDGIKVTNFENDNRYKPLDFHWGTNTVSVKVKLIDASQRKSGGETTDLSLINTHITAENGDYKFDRTPFGTDQIKYIPESVISNSSKDNEFVVMTLWEGDKSMLIIERRFEDNTTKILYKRSLSSIILKNPELSFETDNDFDIVVELLSLDEATIDADVKITINDWVIIYSNEGIS